MADNRCTNGLVDDPQLCHTFKLQLCQLVSILIPSFFCKLPDSFFLRNVSIDKGDSTDDMHEPIRLATGGQATIYSGSIRVKNACTEKVVIKTLHLYHHRTAIKYDEDRMQV